MAGLVLMAPHVFVEPVCLESIASIRDTYCASAATRRLRSRLAKYHARVDDAFLGWADAWLAPEFRAWSHRGPDRRRQRADAADPRAAMTNTARSPNSTASRRARAVPCPVWS